MLVKQTRQEEDESGAGFRSGCTATAAAFHPGPCDLFQKQHVNNPGLLIVKAEDQNKTHLELIFLQLNVYLPCFHHSCKKPAVSSLSEGEKLTRMLGFCRIECK